MGYIAHNIEGIKNCFPFHRGDQRHEGVCLGRIPCLGSRLWSSVFVICWCRLHSPWRKQIYLLIPVRYVHHVICVITPQICTNNQRMVISKTIVEKGMLPTCESLHVFWGHLVERASQCKKLNIRVWLPNRCRSGRNDGSTNLGCDCLRLVLGVKMPTAWAA